MKLDDIKQQGYILALFIRDDGERFLLGTGAYQFKENQLHFIANTFENDIVEVQGNDGILLAGQVRRAAVQPFDGYIAEACITREQVEQYRRDFIAFFRKNHYYKVIYVFNNGSAIKREKGFIVDAPEVKELYQIIPQYHVALNFEDINYYSYAEDAEGQEIYGQSIKVRRASGAQSGGLIWDGVGVVWDGVGATWSESEGGSVVDVLINSIDVIYPVWEVTGPAVNPQISILTTGTTLGYSGTVAEGQTLTVDMINKTATLNGLSVINDINGDWVNLKPGNNKIVYTTDNADAPDCTLRWQEILG